MISTDNLDDIDIGRLDTLEQNLDDAEAKLDAADIEERFQALIDARQQQVCNIVKWYVMLMVKVKAKVKIKVKVKVKVIHDRLIIDIC